MHGPGRSSVPPNSLVSISGQLSAKGAEGGKLSANGPDCKGSNRFCDPLQDPPSLRLGHDAISGSQGHLLGHQLFSLTADGLVTISKETDGADDGTTARYRQP